MPLSPEQKQKRRYRFAPVALLAIVVLAGVSLVKEYLRSYQIHAEIEGLQQQIAGLQAENRKTSDFVEYLKTDSYFEQQARIKLGMKEPGEKVIVIENKTNRITGEPELTSIPSGAIALQTFQRDQRSNPEKWFAYFFGK